MLIATVTRAGRFIRLSRAQPSARSRTAERLPLAGTISAGDGIGRHFTSIEWVVEECRAKLGFVPHPGTLNLRMTGPTWDRAREKLAAAAGIAITPPAGFCGAKCFPVRLAGRIRGALVLPQVAGYPPDKLEIVAPLPVRETLGLADGKRVALTIDLCDGADPLRVGASLDARTAPRREIAWLVSGEQS